MARATKRIVANDAGDIDGVVGEDFSDAGSTETAQETSIATIDPATVDGSDTYEPQVKQRRKRGPNKNKKEKSDSVSLVSRVSTLIAVTGSTIASVSKIPEFVLEQTQCDALAQAINDVAAYHQEFMAFSGRTSAYVMLAIAIGGTGIAQYSKYQSRLEGERSSRVIA